MGYNGGKQKSQYHADTWFCKTKYDFIAYKKKYWDENVVFL